MQLDDILPALKLDVEQRTVIILKSK